MEQKILDHFLETSLFTDAGPYKDLLKKLPNDISEIGLLLRKNLIHPSTLLGGNTGTNSDKRFGDMTLVPWYRQKEDDNLPTAFAMLAELYRRDNRGLVMDRKEENKLIVSCRFTAILMGSILKSKGIPARIRSGFAPYFDEGLFGKVSVDHFINQFWNEKENRWVTIDVDGSLSLKDGIEIDPYDIKDGVFDFSADAWLKVRSGETDAKYFLNAKPERGLIVVLWGMMNDFHCLMNNEKIYLHYTEYEAYDKFNALAENEMTELDELARLMVDPDKNFDELEKIWNFQKKFRLLKGSLL